VHVDLDDVAREIAAMVEEGLLEVTSRGRTGAIESVQLTPAGEAWAAKQQHAAGADR
jgi:hypothetical protein